MRDCSEEMSDCYEEEDFERMRDHSFTALAKILNRMGVRFEYVAKKNQLSYFIFVEFCACSSLPILLSISLLPFCTIQNWHSPPTDVKTRTLHSCIRTTYFQTKTIILLILKNTKILINKYFEVSTACIIVFYLNFLSNSVIYFTFFAPYVSQLLLCLPRVWLSHLWGLWRRETVSGAGGGGSAHGQNDDLRTVSDFGAGF